jgi:hypothetical protein
MEIVRAPVAISLVLWMACAESPPEAKAVSAIRLVTAFAPERVEQAAPAPVALARTELRFGRSLVPLLAEPVAGESSGWTARPAISEHRLDLSAPPWVDREGTAIHDGTWKLIENAGSGNGVPAVELYDARSDLLDQHDVAAEHPEDVARLRAALTAWRTSAAKIQLKTDATAQPNLSTEEIERLRSLGYVQ